MFLPQGGDGAGAEETGVLNNGGLYTSCQSQQDSVAAVWASVGRRASEAVNSEPGENPEKISPAPALGITGAMTRQGHAQGQLETGGEDTVELDVFGEWPR